MEDIATPEIGPDELLLNNQVLGPKTTFIHIN
ncbi:MAG: hypothetical protein ACJA2B_000927 [Candidatus Endobugula sp.]|jgi:hypothetical protein